MSIFYSYTFILGNDRVTSFCWCLGGVEFRCSSLIKFNDVSLKFFSLLFHLVKHLIKDKFSLLFDSLQMFFY